MFAPPPNLESLQENVCQCIADLPPTCPIKRVRQVLDPLMRSWKELVERDYKPAAADVGTEGGGSTTVTANARGAVGRITPLIVACDKGNIACLEYLQEQFNSVPQEDSSLRLDRLQKFLGGPLEVSDGDRNSAMHHAAMAGCSSAIPILQRIVNLLLPQSKGEGDDGRIPADGLMRTTESSSSSLSPVTSVPTSILLLGTVRNSHNDTPLMMAVRSNSPVDFVRTWARLAVGDDDDVGRSPARIGRREPSTDGSDHHDRPAGDDANGNVTGTIRHALQAKNHSMDTCLSMACSHGHIDLVRFLLQDWEIKVEADEVFRCRGSFRRMEQALKSNPDLLKQYAQQRDRVEECLTLLESNLATTTERVVQELLQTCDTDDNHCVGRHRNNGRGPSPKEAENGSQRTDDAARPNGKKKRNQRQNRSAAALKTKHESSIYAGCKQRTDDDEAGGKTSFILTTLDDGKLGVRVTGRDMIEDTLDALPLLRTTTQSLDATDLLRDRFRDVLNSATPVDEVWNALCLDVQSLLYTEHGMALNLSSAQLDAVQQILRHQLSCVGKARAIQQRMHATH
jgi:ankyrin repeat protein